jgi:hypothetical protein
VSDEMRDAINKMVAQKKTGSQSKDTTRKVAIKKIVKPALALPELPEIQNLLELIDIRKIVRDMIQEEFIRLGITPEILAKKAKCECPVEEEYIDDPMDVDLVRIENEKDLTTVTGKIGDLSLSVVVDSGSNKNIMPKFIADELGLEINTNIKHNIRGVSGIRESFGTAPVSIELASGCIIKTDFTIVENYPVRELLLSRTTLRRYNYDLHESREHMAITCNGKHFFIPIVPDINRSQVVKDLST